MIYPDQIILEVTNHCNIRCKYCHFHGDGAKRKRPLGFIKKELWQRIIKEIGNWPKQISLMTHGAGEPLLYKELPELLAFARQYNNISLGFMTNGMLFNNEWTQRALDLSIDWLAFSVDGTDPKKHAFYRRGTDLELIEKHILNLIKEKNKRGLTKPYIMLNMVVYPGMEQEKERFVEKWIAHVNRVMLSKFRPIGSKKLWKNRPSINFQPCPFLFHQCVISFDGKVGLCCEDINVDVKLGDVYKQDILEIYNNQKINNIREMHRQGNLNNISLCSACDIWSAGIIIEKKELGNITYERTPAFEVYEHK